MPSGIYQHKSHSEETKRKIGLNGFHYGMLGKKHSKKTKEKMSETKKGKMPKNICLIKSWWKGKKRSEESKRKQSKSRKGIKPTKEIKNKMSETHKRIGTGKWMKGRKLSEEVKKKISQFWKGKRKPTTWISKGKKHWNWKGGIAPINQKIRGSLEYKLWSDSVWNRDNNCCQECGENRISKLVAHHIQNFAQFPELRFAIDNGITFCRHCHKEFHKKYGYKNNMMEQINEFLNKKSLKKLNK